MSEDEWLDRPGTSEATRGIWGTVVGTLYNQAEQWALQRLREDIAQPLFRSSNRYLARASAVPMGLLLTGEHQMADRIYSKLIDQVDAYANSSGERLYRGPLLNAQAVCRISLGQFDIGIGELLFAAETEALELRGFRPQDTVAKDYIDGFFVEPTMQLITSWCEVPAMQMNVHPPDLFEIREVVDLLDGGWTLLAGIRQAQTIWEAHIKYPSRYSPPRLLDALRGVCASLEDLSTVIGVSSNFDSVKAKFASAQTVSLGRTLGWLFSDRFLTTPASWWAEFNQMTGLTTFRSDDAATDFGSKLETIRDTVLPVAARCFLASVLARNYCAHQLRPDRTFIEIEDNSSPFLSSMQFSLLSLVLLMREARDVGHMS
jgi:hypothetical protein